MEKAEIGDEIEITKYEHGSNTSDKVTVISIEESLGRVRYTSVDKVANYWTTHGSYKIIKKKISELYPIY